MNKDVVKVLVDFFRTILSKNKDLNLPTNFVLGVSKALFYLDNHEKITPTGKFSLSSHIEENDGFNTTNHSYFLKISKNTIEISSKHSFHEAYGKSHESHSEQVYPNKRFGFTESLESYNHWESEFLKGLSIKYFLEENLGGLKIKTDKI